ncbi:NAD(P)-dependent alcohol dehydrogenase [Amycolatopsis sp. NPDC059021]|uniref:NAD(P)-dependent alcohol dehydrogenase n=1 Tax=Amycolatopsis sp. NPDC059021 TaxID=3346704 RepID=UPI0036710B34
MITTATAALLEAPGKPLSLEQVELPVLVGDEILVKMKSASICHTDVLVADGVIPYPLPMVPGHEGAGIVEEVGPGERTLSVGDTVVLSFDSCRQCVQCTTGHPAYCELFGALNYTGTRLDGSVTLSRKNAPVHGSWFGQSSLATHAIASSRNAVKVPGGLPWEILAPLGCGLLTGAGTVCHTLCPAAGQSMVVFGLGAVGLSAVMAASDIGCTPLIGVDPHPQRRALAEELGCTHVIDPYGTEDLGWSIAEILGPGADFTVDTVGSGTVVRQALEALRTPGRCATLGVQAMENDITIDQGHLLLGRSLHGVIEGDADPHTFIPRLLDRYQDGRFPLERLVRTYPFPRINEALDAARAGTAVKAVLLFD